MNPPPEVHALSAPLLTIGEFCIIAGISRPTFYRRVHEGLVRRNGEKAYAEDVLKLAARGEGRPRLHLLPPIPGVTAVTPAMPPELRDVLFVLIQDLQYLQGVVRVLTRALDDLRRRTKPATRSQKAPTQRKTNSGTKHVAR